MRHAKQIVRQYEEYKEEIKLTNDQINQLNSRPQTPDVVEEMNRYIDKREGCYMKLIDMRQLKHEALDYISLHRNRYSI